MKINHEKEFDLLQESVVKEEKPLLLLKRE